MAQDRTADLADVLTTIGVLGVGLISLITAIAPGSADRYEEAMGELFAAHDLADAAPDELLVAGVALEDLVVAALSRSERAAGVPLRLVPGDVPVDVSQNTYWIVGLDDALPEVPDGYEVQELDRHDGLVLVEWSRDEEEGGRRWKLSERVETASARYVADGETQRECSVWRFGRLLCGPGSWNYVGVTDVVVAKKPAKCIWAHPLNGHELRVRFTNVPFATDLRGRYALADVAAELEGGSPLDLRVEVNGEEEVKRLVPNKVGWQNFNIKQQADTTRAEIEFVISAANDGKRHFCFDLEPVIRPAPRRAKGKP